MAKAKLITDEELRVIADLYYTTPVKEIASMLGRPTSTIGKQLPKLGLKRRSIQESKELAEAYYAKKATPDIVGCVLSKRWDGSCDLTECMEG